MKTRLLWLLLLPLLLGAGAKPAGVTEAQVRAKLFPLSQASVESLKPLGPGLLTHLAKIYSTTESTADRTTIAGLFYALGWKSPEAKAALLKDIATTDEGLRVNVQYALGRVSDEKDVVETLYLIMRNDPNPFFRDKAACALAYDQTHLTEKQKVDLYAKLIDGLSDEKGQVRQISIQALQIHTGQTKDFHAYAKPADRARAIDAWRQWLDTYRRSL